MRRYRCVCHGVKVRPQELRPFRHVLRSVDPGLAACVVHRPPLPAFTQQHTGPCAVIYGYCLPAVVRCMGLQGPEVIPRDVRIVLDGAGDVAQLLLRIPIRPVPANLTWHIGLSVRGDQIRIGLQQCRVHPQMGQRKPVPIVLVADAVD